MQAKNKKKRIISGVPRKAKLKVENIDEILILSNIHKFPFCANSKLTAKISEYSMGSFRGGQFAGRKCVSKTTILTFLNSFVLRPYFRPLLYCNPL